MSSYGLYNNIKAIMDCYAENEYSKGDVKEDSSVYVGRMAKLFYDYGIAETNDRFILIEEAITEGNMEEALYRVGLCQAFFQELVERVQDIMICGRTD